MEYDDFVDAVEREVDRIADAASRGAMTDPSPTCPAFTKRELVTHIGEFYGFWTHLVCEGRGVDKTPYSELDDQDPAVWLSDLGASMVGQFRSTSANQTMWTWNPDEQRVGFAARRACHELSIHRVDVELISGPSSPVEAHVAADGIDEVMFLANHGVAMGFGTLGSGESMHLHGTDVETAEWMVHIGPETMTVTHEHAKGDLAIRASVSDLEMLLYQRPTLGDVEYFGDKDVLAVFHQTFTFDDE